MQIILNLIIKISKQKMLAGASFKNSFTTLTSQTKAVCLCGSYDKQTLRQKLEQILESLLLEISKKQMEVQNIKISFLQDIHEKQEIIQRLATANSKLVLQNQMLTKKLSRFDFQYQTKLKSVQARCHLKMKELNSVISYLQQKNEQLKNQIMSKLRVKQYTLKRSSSPNYQMTRPHRFQIQQASTKISGRRSDMLNVRSNQRSNKKRSVSKEGLLEEFETHTLNYKQYLNSFEESQCQNKKLQISRTKSSISSKIRHSCGS